MIAEYPFPPGMCQGVAPTSLYTEFVRYSKKRNAFSVFKFVRFAIKVVCILIFVIE